LPSKNPKWNESFKFEVNNIGDEIRITLYNKFIFSREDKLGSLVFSLESLQNYNTTDWFVLFDDDN
jgi:Ca2+-dependent lipid-binding protein